MLVTYQGQHATRPAYIRPDNKEDRLTCFTCLVLKQRRIQELGLGGHLRVRFSVTSAPSLDDKGVESEMPGGEWGGVFPFPAD